jgi:hypothetical protein
MQEPPLNHRSITEYLKGRGEVELKKGYHRVQISKEGYRFPKAVNTDSRGCVKTGLLHTPSDDLAKPSLLSYAWEAARNLSRPTVLDYALQHRKTLVWAHKPECPECKRPCKSKGLMCRDVLDVGGNGKLVYYRVECSNTTCEFPPPSPHNESFQTSLQESCLSCLCHRLQMEVHSLLRLIK